VVDDERKVGGRSFQERGPETAKLRDRYVIVHVSLRSVQGRRHGFESGGGTILRAERAKKFFDPPTFWPVGGGQNIA